MLLGVLSSLAEGIGIGLFIPFLQEVDLESSHGSANWLIVTLSDVFESISPESRLYVVAVGIFGAILLKALLQFANVVHFHRLDAYFTHRLRTGIFDNLLTVRYGFLEHTPSGRIVNALTTETFQTSIALSVFVDMVVAGCTVFVFVGLMLLLSWKMTLAVGVAVTLAAVAMQPLTRHALKIGNKETAENSILTRRMVEGIAGMQTIRAFGRESDERQQFDEKSRSSSSLRQKRKIVSAAIGPFYEVLAAAVLVAILSTTIGDPARLPLVLVFVVLLLRLHPKVIQIGQSRVTLASLVGAVREVTSLFHLADDFELSSGTKQCDDLNNAIRFEGVSFRYNKDDGPVLDDVFLNIPAGKTTAIVGPSGAGKSTLIKLILRLYDVTEGEIFVDNIPLSEFDLSAWRNHMAMVSQDVFLFDTSVRENIAYGRQDATLDDVISAAQQAMADQFIESLPQGYDTNIGERGVRLSGGQKQRIALARAIIRNPPILILDEATNALDSLSERFVQNTLDTLSENRTVIVIAHRFSTIERADHVVVLDKGRVREQGDLQHLLELDGMFAQLRNIQYGIT